MSNPFNRIPLIRKLNRWAPWPWLVLINVVILSWGVALLLKGEWWLLATGMSGMIYAIIGWTTNVRTRLKGQR